MNSVNKEYPLGVCWIIQLLMIFQDFLQMRILFQVVIPYQHRYQVTINMNDPRKISEYFASQ